MFLIDICLEANFVLTSGAVCPILEPLIHHHSEGGNFNEEAADAFNDLLAVAWTGECGPCAGAEDDFGHGRDGRNVLSLWGRHGEDLELEDPRYERNGPVDRGLRGERSTHQQE